MHYKTRTHPIFSACGLNCGLCPRFHTVGTSRCPGCAGEGFSQKHPACGVLSCCQKHGLECCNACDAYPCAKYDGADQSDSFITHLHQFSDMALSKEIGMDAYVRMLDAKMALLGTLLSEYDDGRRKGFYCLAVNLLPLPSIEEMLSDVAKGTVRERALAMVEALSQKAEEMGVSLVLRKKAKP